MTPRIHSRLIWSLERGSFEAASCHDLTTTGLNSRCHVPRQVIEALLLSIRYMNTQAWPFPPFQSTHVCSLGIFCTRTPARHSKASICSRFSPSSRRSCDVSARDCRCDQLHIDRQCRKSSSALIIKEIARCCKSRLLDAKTASSPRPKSIQLNQDM